MLEQPPERDLLATQTEEANTARSQIKPTHWSYRTIVWIMPFILAVLIFFGAICAKYTLYNEETFIRFDVLILAVMLTSSAVNFGIGYFDAHLSKKLQLSDGKRKKEKFVYATTFMIAQWLVMPAILIGLLVIMLVVTCIRELFTP